MAKLVVITKGALPSSHELGEGWITIGRADDNSVQIVEQSILSRHCEVRVRGEELLVRDLISTNGTFINDHKIEEGIVQAGDILRLGDVQLRFETNNLAAIAAKSFKSKLPPAGNASEHDPEPATKRPPSVVLLNEAIEKTKRSQVLFVDDSMAFLDAFSGLCAELSGLTWKIHTASSADEALTIMHTAPIDLVVLDVGLPMLDGLQLLDIINRRHPGMKIAVMTGLATETRRADALAKGAELFLEKPITSKSMQSTFKMLLDLLSWSHEGFTGALKNVQLEEIIQVECLSKRSSILEIRNPEMQGHVYLEDGEVVHAQVGEMFGEPAFRKLVALRGGEFQLRPFQKPLCRTVNTPWKQLLASTTPVKTSEEGTKCQRKKSTAKTPLPKPGLGGHLVIDKSLIQFPPQKPGAPPDLSRN